MCQQPFTACRNYTCDGVAVYPPLIPCDQAPNCETTLVRVPRKRDGSAQYCPRCMTLTKKQRKAETTRASRQRRASEAKAQAQQAQQALGTTNAAQTAQSPVAESSAMGANADDARHLRGTTSAQVEQSPVAESSATGANANADTDDDDDARHLRGETLVDDTVDAPEFDYPTAPQPEHPGFVEAMTSGFMPIPDPFAQPLAPPPPPSPTLGSQSRSPSPPIPVDPLLTHMNVLRDNGIELEDRVAGERLLRRLGLWPDYLL
ncbi:hypothetical protein MMC07_003172 [Pseudocyphellaria aurata]|nr:hypothetical protein [Pseudocyphellaria aurata]